MKNISKYLAILALLVASTSAFAVTAFWTGRQEQVQTVTYQWGWNCEYDYAGQKFWVVFDSFCQSTVNVQ